MYILKWDLLIYENNSVFNFLRTIPAAAAAAKSLQSCLTLCDPIDGSSPGSAVPGILQARTLEWVAISFSIMLGLFYHNLKNFNSEENVNEDLKVSSFMTR